MTAELSLLSWTMKSGLKDINVGKGDEMETVIALLVVILIGFWAVNILKPRKENKKERFIGYMQRYDIDGEGYQSEVWEVAEDENEK